MRLDQSDNVEEEDATGNVPLPYFSLNNGTIYAV